MARLGPVAARVAPVVRIGRARPTPAAGLRAAVATVVPLLAAHAFGEPALAYGGLAGFLTTLADKGGSYRARATSTGTLTCVGACAATLGAMTAGTSAVQAPLTFVVVAACGFALAYGTTAGSVGLSTAILFVAALGTPATAAAAVARGGAVLLGGTWAMLSALWLWPIRPYRPARTAVAACYRAIGALADAIASTTERRSGTAFQSDLSRRSTEIRSAIESGRAVLAATRRGRIGETARGERLLVLLESADQMFVSLLALAEVLATNERATDPADRVTISTSIDALGSACRALATLVERERAVASDVPIWTADAGPAGPAATAVVDRLRELWSVAADVVAGITVQPTPYEVLPQAPRPALGALLRSHLTTRSVVFRHAFRTATTAAVAVALTSALDLERGYWVTISAIVIVQPYAGASTTKGLQRIAGTVVGCVLTAVLASLVHASPAGVLALVFGLAAVGVSVLPLNYGVYTAFTTATFVLLAESTAGDWHLAGTRIVNSTIGGALALAATWFLWPEPERARFPEHVAALVRANAEYLRAALAGLRAHAPLGEEVTAARRALGLASINAEASLQRLLTESPGDEALLEPSMALLTYNRRFSRGVTAMLSSGHALPELVDPAAGAAEALSDLADALESGTPPPPLPTSLDASVNTPLDGAIRRLRVMHDAADRLLQRSGM